jgi:hypothetical protein
MDYTLLFDVRYSGSFTKGTRMIQEIFAAAHRLSRDCLYAVDFPGQSDPNTTLAHMTALGHQVRLFGDREHLLRVRDRLDGKYGKALLFSDVVDWKAMYDRIGYVQVLSFRPRKSAAQAARRIREHLERRGVVLTHEITEGDPDYAYPDGAYITYESLSTGKRFPFWVRRRKAGKNEVIEDFHSFDRFGFSRGGWLPVVKVTAGEGVDMNVFD